MFSCTRMRLCIALGDFDAARETGATLNAVAAERGLVRTRMRGLALAMALEHRAGTESVRGRIWRSSCGCSPRRTTRGRLRASGRLPVRCSAR